MNIAEISLRYRTVVVVLSLTLIAAGLWAYRTLGRLEDPAFAIKQAVVTTQYPGASPAEVADEVSDPVEAAIQDLKQVDYVTSISTAGRSIVKVHIKDRYGGEDLPQIWDELRRKVQAASGRLPPGATPPAVNDDFGDVYGVLFYVYGDGFGLSELHEHAKRLRKELLLLEGVGSVQILGQPQEAIFVEVPRDRLRLLGGGLGSLLGAMEGQASVASAGDLVIGEQRWHVNPTGQLDSVQAIRDLLLVSQEGTTRLGDVAEVRRGLTEPPGQILHYNGLPAVAVGVSTVPGGNVVTMGDAVKNRLQELSQQTPVGIELGIVSMQSDAVRHAVRGFTISLVESVVIVVGVLLLAMGLRAGALIGGILVLTIMTTFMVMKLIPVDLQRISLGALIIALGMLVDNAIVITEGLQAGAARGISRAKAACSIVGQTTWPLLGATVIAVLAFAPIGLSPDSTGDYCGSLFTVILVSLMLSWVFALTTTPVVGANVLAAGGAGGADPYGGRLFRMLRSVLEGVLRRRYLALAVVVVVLAASVIGFGKAKQGFFPASARPQFLVEYWTPQGTDIRAVERQMEGLEQWMLKLPGVTDVSSSMGAGTQRFELTYSPESPNPSYGQLIVSVQDHRLIEGLMQQTRQRLVEEQPDAQAWPWRMVLGPGGEAKIQARLRGKDPSVLRQLAQQVEQIMASDHYSTAIRNDWRSRVMTLQPVLAEPQASRAGITRRDASQALAVVYGGVRVGLYRENEDMIPVVLRAPAQERNDAASIAETLVWSSRAAQPIPLGQVTRGTSVGWEDPILARRNRVPTITVMCDPAAGPAPALLARLRPAIEAIDLPPGYTLEWGGEFEKAAKAQGGLQSLMPLCGAGIVLILIALFNNLRQPLIILLTVPLAVVGITVGLLSTGAEFGFMAILGTLSLAGMLIKNAIVLIDEANAQTARGVDHYTAIVDSAISRARPVAMAAATTVLGMIPLLTDVFFKDMAVVIMFGLSFATVLTIVVVPLFYAVFYRAYPRAVASSAAAGVATGA